MNGPRMDKHAKYELGRVSDHYTDILFLGELITLSAVGRVSKYPAASNPSNIRWTQLMIHFRLVDTAKRQLATSRHPEVEVGRSQQQKRDVVDY